MLAGPVSTRSTVAWCAVRHRQVHVQGALASIPAASACAGWEPNWPRPKNEPTGALTAGGAWPPQLISIQVSSRAAAAAVPAAAVTPGMVSLTDWIESGPPMSRIGCGTPGFRLTWPETAVFRPC